MTVRSLLEQIHQLGRQERAIENHVRLPRLVKVERRARALDGQEIDHLVQHIRGVPVSGVAPDANLLAQPPRDERVRSARGQRLARQPAVAVLFDRLPRHHGQGAERADIREKRRGRHELDAQGANIQRLDAEFGRWHLAPADGLAVLHEEKLARVIGGGIRIDHATPGINKVIRGDRFARGPEQVAAQVKGVGPAVARDRPALGQAGNGLGRFRIETRQPLEKAHGHAAVRLAANDGRIDRLRLGGVDDDDVGARLPFAAADHGHGAAKKQRTKTNGSPLCKESRRRSHGEKLNSRPG
jgi:hypothetical protein